MRAEYIGLLIMFVGGSMGLYTNLNQLVLDATQGVISCLLIAGSIGLFVWRHNSSQK